MVPTLVHDGQAIGESSVINEYIDAAFPGVALVPQDPLKAARMREFTKACDDGFDAIAKLTMVKYILPKLRNRWGDEVLREQAARRPTKFLQDLHSRAVRGEIPEAELRESRASIEALLDRLEKTLSSGPWIVGDFSLADISVAPFMFRLAALGQEQFWTASSRPRVHQWYAQISRRPAFIKAVSWPDENGGGYQEVGLLTEASS